MESNSNDPKAPPAHLREQIATTMTPLPHWYQPFEDAQVSHQDFPLHALTQRPMHMYHSWGSQNAWLRQITTQNRLFLPLAVWQQGQFKEGDWAYVTSAHGQIKVPVALMEGLNPNTVWTWNAIGKRKGAWALDDDAPEAKQGFLLNHLINELLPERRDGHRWANSDPITGQAAWFDLRVRVERIPVHSSTQSKDMRSEPEFASLKLTTSISQDTTFKSNKEAS